MTVAAPFTGRANIYAAAAGLAQIDATAIARLNGIDEAVTIATVAPFERVQAGQMLATIKIIPFAVPAATMAALGGCRWRHGDCNVAVHTERAALILTRLAVDEGERAEKACDCHW